MIEKWGVVGGEEEPGAERVGGGVSVLRSFKTFPLRFRALIVIVKLEAG